MSFEILVPAHAPSERFAEALDALEREAAAHGAKLLVVDDGLDQDWRDHLDARPALRRIAADGRGAAAALQIGLEAGDAEWLLQIDQDVVVDPGFAAELLTAVEPRVAAVQGWYRAAEADNRWQRWAAWDLEQRWSQSADPCAVDHVCSGVTLYRREALEAVGGFPQNLGYGYDSELSARLSEAGWRLLRCRRAGARHDFPASALASFRQHLGQGYGRLELCAARRDRARGDQVSSFGLILHAAGTAMASVAGLAALAAAPLSPLAAKFLGFGAGLLTAAVILACLGRGLAAARTNHQPARLGLALFCLWRDLAWAAACWRFAGDRLGGRAGPQRSMPRRPPGSTKKRL